MQLTPLRTLAYYLLSVSSSANLPLHHKVQKFSSGTGSPRWSRKKGRTTVVVSHIIVVLHATTDQPILWFVTVRSGLALFASSGVCICFDVY